jgi:hypothetical protein
MPVHALQPVVSMLDPPATRAEIVELIGDGASAGDGDAVERILAVGASLDEIGLAIDDLEGRLTDPHQAPSSERVTAVRAILADLDGGSSGGARTFSMLGDPVRP